MISLRVLAAGSVFCALLAMASIQPTNAANPAQTPEEDSDPAMVETSGAPSATLEVASEQMRLIMGGTAGKGVLHFGGKDYPFSYKSASAGVGGKVVKEMSAVGEVYSLDRIEDFEGEYAAVNSSALAGQGELEATYRNSKGVVVKLKGTIKGVGLSLGAGVATIKLIKD